MCAVSKSQDHTERPPHFCLGFILGGGHSTRMGQDKASVCFNGKPLLEITRSLLDTAPLNGHYVVGGKFATFPENTVGRGPAIAICDVLLQLQCSKQGFALFVPLDMPLLSLPTLLTLIDRARITEQAVYYENFVLPLIIPASSATHRAAKQLLDRGSSVSVHKLLDTLNAQSIPFDGDANVMANVNSPQDLASISKLIY